MGAEVEFVESVEEGAEGKTKGSAADNSDSIIDNRRRMAVKHKAMIGVGVRKDIIAEKGNILGGPEALFDIEEEDVVHNQRKIAANAANDKNMSRFSRSKIS